MDKTKIAVEFGIGWDGDIKSDIQDNEVAQMITDKLELEPTKIILHKIPLKKYGKKEFTWLIDTGYSECWELQKEIDKMLNILIPKKEQLLELKEQLVDATFRLNCIIDVGKDEEPALSFDERTIHFLDSLDAFIDIDMSIF